MEVLKLKLTPRLNSIALLVDKGSSVVDVGTDHGYIPLFLITNGLANKCIATDVNEGPLNAAKETLDLFGITDKVSLRLGDGLGTIKNNDDVNTVIIAGMGGETIIKIIKDGLEKIQGCCLILQPMTEVVAVRKFLMEHSFKIVDEVIAPEGQRFYEILKVVKSPVNVLLTQKELRFGPVLLKNRGETLLNYLKKQSKKNKVIIENMLNSDNTDEKIKVLQYDSKLLKEVIIEIEGTDYN